MSLRIFTGCDGKYLDLTVQIALNTSTSSFPVWDTALWDTAVWGPDEVWTDVSPWVRKVQSNRELTSDLRAWSAGKCTIVLNNVDGRFSPDNLAGPYVAGGISQIIPGRPAQITMSYAGITYPIFFGYIDVWSEGYDMFGPRKGDAYMEASGSDEWQRISRPDGVALTPAGAGETFGARVMRVLNSIGFSRTADLDVGSIPFQATDLSSKPVDELVVTAASEGGTIMIGPDGTLIGRDRYSLVEDTRSVNVQTVFGDGGGSEVPWEKLDVSPLSTDQVINTAQYTAVGGVQQLAFDPSSRALYGIISDGASWADKLICVNDSDVDVLAQWTVMANKDPAVRIKSITLRPRCNPDLMIPKTLGAQIRDLIEAVIRPPSGTGHIINRSCFISGINITVENGDVVVVLSTSPATIYRAFSQSRWDVGLWGASDVDPNGARFFI